MLLLATHRPGVSSRISSIRWIDRSSSFCSVRRGEATTSRSAPLEKRRWRSDGQTLTNGLTGTWANAGDQKALLNYDWALAPGGWVHTTPSTIKLKSTKSGKTKVLLPGFAGNWNLEMETIRDMETRDGDAFEYGDDDMGCEECGVPGSTIRLELQKNRAQDLRLRVVAACFCECNTVCYNGAEAEDAETFYVPMQSGVAKKAKA